MKSTRILWHAWFGDSEVELIFPAAWHVHWAYMADAPPIEPGLLPCALRQPIGSKSLRELATGSTKAAIVVEDITRPTPTAEVLPAIFAELEEGGLDPTDIWIVVGLGAHTPMDREALIKKLGRGVVERYAIYQHQPYENLTYLGTTFRGTPVYISRFYLEADLRIGVGSITPHSYAGFGGGAKIVAVGVAGMETLAFNHLRVGATGEAVCVDSVEGNDCRSDLEEIAELAGLQFVVNGVVNSRRELAGIFAGHPVKAHRAGVEFARRVYVTNLPPPVDVVILNAYPKDTELVQWPNALNAVGFDLRRVLAPGGTAVIVAACPQGGGVHYLGSVGMRGYSPRERDKVLGGHDGIVFSQNLAQPEVDKSFPLGTRVFSHWQDLIGALEERYGPGASVAVFPCAALQIPNIG